MRTSVCRAQVQFGSTLSDGTELACCAEGIPVCPRNSEAKDEANSHVGGRGVSICRVFPFCELVFTITWG